MGIKQLTTFSPYRVVVFVSLSYGEIRTISVIGSLVHFSVCWSTQTFSVFRPVVWVWKLYLPF